MIVAILTVVVEIAEEFPQTDQGYALPTDTPSWLNGWCRWDSNWYYAIVNDGYYYLGPSQQSPVAFFPAYPMLVRGVRLFVGNTGLSMWLVAVALGLATVLLFAYWVTEKLPRRAALTSIVIAMVYPYSLYISGAMYAESTFLFGAIAAFLAVDRRNYWLAGLAGIIATAARPLGMAVVVGLVIRVLEQLAEDRSGRVPTPTHQGRSVSVVRPRFVELIREIRTAPWQSYLVLLSALGIIAWCLFLWHDLGHPLAWIEVESAPGWDQGQGPRTWFKVILFEGLIAMRKGLILVLPQVIVMIMGWCFLRRVFRLFGWGYAAYVFVALAIPTIGTRDFTGAGRYILLAFPLFAAVGDYFSRLPKRWMLPATIVILAVGLILATAAFTMGGYIA